MKLFMEEIENKKYEIKVSDSIHRYVDPRNEHIMDANEHTPA